MPLSVGAKLGAYEIVSLLGNGGGRSVECEYHRGVLPVSESDILFTGLGAVMSRATDSVNLAMLLAAPFVISAMVIPINRLLWRRLYALASTRFKLEFT